MQQCSENLIVEFLGKSVVINSDSTEPAYKMSALISSGTTEPELRKSAVINFGNTEPALGQNAVISFINTDPALRQSAVVNSGNSGPALGQSARINSGVTGPEFRESTAVNTGNTDSPATQSLRSERARLSVTTEPALDKNAVNKSGNMSPAALALVLSISVKICWEAAPRHRNTMRGCFLWRVLA